jgi:hypothetical protein
MPFHCQKLSAYTFMTLWQEHEKLVSVLEPRTSNSVILASFYSEMIKLHDEIPIRSGFAVIFHTCVCKNVFRGKLAS